MPAFKSEEKNSDFQQQSSSNVVNHTHSLESANTSSPFDKTLSTDRSPLGGPNSANDNNPSIPLSTNIKTVSQSEPPLGGPNSLDPEVINSQKSKDITGAFNGVNNETKGTPAATPQKSWAACCFSWFPCCAPSPSTTPTSSSDATEQKTPRP